MRHKRIPGKKHKGFKDPEAQHAKRMKGERMNVKINSAPNNLDDQEIPKKLRLMIEAKSNYLEKRKSYDKYSSKADVENIHQTENDKSSRLLDSTKHMGYEMTLPGMTKPLKPIPVFKQMPGERKNQFYNRMNQTVQAVLKRKTYEEKFDVDVTDDPITGETKVKDRAKDEIDLEMEKVKNKKRRKKGINVRTKEEKRQMRREKDKERKRKRKGGISNEEKPFDFDHSKFVDHVKFNDVVHAPPENLSGSHNKKIVKNYAERNPGKQNNLLLNKKLDKKGTTKNISSKVVKTKKTDISLARKCMLEAERKRVIELYRKSKNKR